MRKIFTAVVLATLIATPAFAATRHHQLAHSPAQQLQASPPIFMYAPDPPQSRTRRETQPFMSAVFLPENSVTVTDSPLDSRSSGPA